MAMKKKGYRNGGKVKKMMKGGAAGGMKKPKRMMKGGAAGGMKKPRMMKKGGAAGGVMTLAQLKKSSGSKRYEVSKKIMSYLYSNIPYFKAWVRREYTHNHEIITANFFMLWS